MRTEAIRLLQELNERWIPVQLPQRVLDVSMNPRGLGELREDTSENQKELRQEIRSSTRMDQEDLKNFRFLGNLNSGNTYFWLAWYATHQEVVWADWAGQRQVCEGFGQNPRGQLMFLNGIVKPNYVYGVLDVDMLEQKDLLSGWRPAPIIECLRSFGPLHLQIGGDVVKRVVGRYCITTDDPMDVLNKIEASRQEVA